MFALMATVDDLGLADDCELSPAVIVAALAVAEPGAQLHGWLSMLDPDRLSEAQVLDAGAALERQRRHDAAVEFALLARLESLPVALPELIDPDGDRCSETTGPQRWAARLRSARVDAYAAVTAQSPITVSRKSAAAVALAPDGALAATGAALAAGHVSEIRAKVIAEQLAQLDPVDVAAIEAAVLPGADLLSRRRLEQELMTRKAALDPRTEREQHVEARTRRCVSSPMPLPAGMAFLEVLGPADDLHVLYAALTAVASGAAEAAQAAARDASRGNPAEPSFEMGIEGIDAHRFDALINLAAGILSDDGLPTQHGHRPAIGITVALGTLLGLDDHPADLAGYGPITAEAARRAAHDPTATWQRLITAPNGLVIDAAYTSYRPPQALRDTVAARDRHCTFPRCTRRALACDIDHQDPWPDGATSLNNNHALCRRHHNLKTARLAVPEYDPGTGDTEWILATGHTVRRPAERHRQPDPPPVPDDTDPQMDPHADPQPAPDTDINDGTADMPVLFGRPQILRQLAAWLAATNPSAPNGTSYGVDARQLEPESEFDDPPPF